MGSWKNHVRARLEQRDFKEKHPFIGVFSSLSQLEERLEIREQIWEDMHDKSVDGGEGVTGKDTQLIQLQLKESEHLVHKLSQTVSDLTSVLYLKEAELQYWQSCVSQHRQEALTLAKRNSNLNKTLVDLEFTVDLQFKELAALRLEKNKMKEALDQAHVDQEQTLHRWIEEKKKEADRLNKYNDKQERWQHVAKQLRKQLQGQRGKKSGANGTSSSAIQSKSFITMQCSNKRNHQCSYVSGLKLTRSIQEDFSRDYVLY
ncbi:transcript variant X2 [Nothobranchius furzeri]|uniref:Transcript variant X2 n=1 Tax=Nothobranchius furzeri TaxID=105023 RepID=A0A9D3BU97_NOTFU|nr:transcript variant X2 [Nothobranchius furzeri]